MQQQVANAAAAAAAARAAAQAQAIGPGTYVQRLHNQTYSFPYPNLSNARPIKREIYCMPP